MARMRARALRFALVALAVAAGSTTLPAQYSLTVNKDRLMNAQNEPQNWLLMNGDYAGLRYSRLTQINRDNVKNLRMVWAMALGGMQDVGQNGPENELNPLIDGGFMYTSDGWGTIYKIDARNGSFGKFVWIADPGVQHEGQHHAHARHRALGRQGLRQPARRARDRHQPRQRRDRLGQEDHRRRTSSATRSASSPAPLVADGKVLVQNGAGDGGTRGWVAALDVKDGKELWRWYTVPKPGDPGQRELEGRSQRVEDRAAAASGRPASTIRSRTSTSSAPATRSRSTTRSSARATTSTPTRWSRSTSPPASWRGTSSTRRTTRGTTTKPAPSSSTTP
jgi:alcohol dehydrogenase (cytochrome c)